MRSIIYLALLFLSACATSEQPDYGWVVKPKSAHMERYNSKASSWERIWDRTYHLTQDRLDSIVELKGEERNVYTGFVPAFTNLRIVPWDFSVAATKVGIWLRDSTANWQLVGKREDSIFRGRRAGSTLSQRDSTGNWRVVYKEFKEYDEQGYITADLIDRIGRMVTGDRYLLQRDPSGRLIRMTNIGLHDTVGFPMRSAMDTERVMIFRYDDDKLVEVIDSSWSLGSRSRYAEIRVTRSYDLELFDSVADFSLDAIPTTYAVFPQMKYLRSGKQSTSGFHSEAPKWFELAVDDRFRLVKQVVSDTMLSTATYYEDNSIRESALTSQGKTLYAKRNVRSYDKQNRITLLESQMTSLRDTGYVPTERMYFSY